MRLDVLTTRGQETLEHEARAAEIWRHHRPHVAYLHTPKDQPATVDALLATPDDCIVGIVEQKSRDMSVDRLIAWRCEWLVTLEKIRAASRICAALRVPLFGFLYLIPDDTLIVRRICDVDGQPIARIRTERTTTRATVNGGTAQRVNAFVDMSGASSFTIHAEGRLPGRSSE